MLEIRTGEPQDPDIFAERIAQKGLPIEKLDAMNFARFAIREGAPHGFLDRLAESMQYKSEDEFAADFDNYSEMVQEELSGKPYAVMYYKRFGSGRWIHQSLQSKGLHPASLHFALENYNKHDNLFQEMRLHDADDISILLPEGTTLLVPEDIAVTGLQVGELARIGSDANLDVRVTVMYTTENAENFTRNWGKAQAFRSLPGKIKNLDASLNKQDLVFIHKLHDMFFNPRELSGREPFFWTWYKVPDNVYKIFTEQSPYPLVRSNKFVPPYPRG